MAEVRLRHDVGDRRLWMCRGDDGEHRHDVAYPALAESVTPGILKALASTQVYFVI
jgi:hypothetical protein